MLILPFLAGVTAIEAGCEPRACTTSWPDCSYQVTVEGLEAGLYDVTLALDGRSVACAAAVPSPTPGSDEAGAIASTVRP